MTLFLFLLFVQFSCGSASGIMNQAIIAVTPMATISPTDGTSDAPTSSHISISFNSVVEGATVNADTFKIAGPEGAISGTISINGPTTATFTPDVPLMPLTRYRVLAAPGIKAANGTNFGSRASSFTTARDLPLRSSWSAIPSSYFGLHIHRADTTTVWPTAQLQSWRLWDAYVAWPWLEPKKDQWHFDRLDKCIELAKTHDVEPILTLGLTPTWASARPDEHVPYAVEGSPAEPASIEDWKSYVRTVATRYKGRIRYYEIWNEPNIKIFFTGSAAKMAELARSAYQVLKEVDPSIIVISPSATGVVGYKWVENYLSLGGGNYCDVVGYHFYVSPDAPEAIPVVIRRLQSTLEKYRLQEKELWDTEVGWYSQNRNSTVKGTGIFSKVLTDTETSAFLARSYILNWANGVSRLYWYSWDNPNMGLTEADGLTLKPAAASYNEIKRWLTGARMTSCASTSRNLWVAQVTRENGYKAWIVWSPNKSLSFTAPNEWKAVQVRELHGKTTPLTAAEVISVGSVPVMFENKRIW